MEGKYILLRAIEETDLALIKTWNFAPEITQFFPPRWPVTMQEQKSWFEEQANSSSKKRLIVCDRETQAPIGLLGVLNIDHVNKNCEIGVTIGEMAYWGKPHTAEAMKICMQFLFWQLNMHIIYLRVMQSNKRAVSYFEKNGFKQNGILRDMIYMNGNYESWIWMSITREEFDKD
jgi:RimJ/RimL family protein N-acetyltransferase